MITRQQFEKHEAQFLAPYACRSAESLGRVHREKEHDYRTAFQRDRDRIIHTSAFRKLEYKTQVFVIHEGDYYRTRLTHTLEMSQMGRTIARALAVNEDLTEAICLAHDLGHTPFGHSGQDIMNKLMTNHGGFEHNLQSFRVVTQLENPYPQFKGLNLSYEVLEGITKHASQYDMPDGMPFIKEGFPSIEAQIANVSDEIAYNNHDIDDGLESGILNWETLNEVRLWATQLKKTKKEFPHLTPLQLRRFTVKSLINLLITDLIETTAKRIATRRIKTVNDVRVRGKSLVGFSKEMVTLNSELKKFLFKNLYRYYHVERMAEKADRVLSDLFKTYVHNPKIMPPEILANSGKADTLERVVCDYIAGMTDRFALEEHAKLFDPQARV